MTLEEIISAAVASEVKNLVAGLMERTCQEPGSYNTTKVERVVEKEIERIAREEVTKHSESIRSAVIESLKSAPVRFEINTYAKAVVPEHK